LPAVATPTLSGSEVTRRARVVGRMADWPLRAERAGCRARRLHWDWRRAVRGPYAIVI